MDNKLLIGWDDYYNTNVDTPWKEDPDSYLVKNISKYKGTHVLDIACGDGRNTSLLKDFEYICCLDISSTALKKLGERFSSTYNKKPILLKSDFLQTNLIDNQFDLIICFDGLPQMENTTEVISKAISLLKIGGIFIFNFFTKNDCAYGEGEKVDENTFTYKGTLFKFLDYNEVIPIIPKNSSIKDSTTMKWDDPPHGDFRPYPHTHEAVYFTLIKTSE